MHNWIIFFFQKYFKVGNGKVTYRKYPPLCIHNPLRFEIKPSSIALFKNVQHFVTVVVQFAPIVMQTLPLISLRLYCELPKAPPVQYIVPTYIYYQYTSINEKFKKNSTMYRSTTHYMRKHVIWYVSSYREGLWLLTYLLLAVIFVHILFSEI